ncbi:Ig-like domain-containing protein, partial [Brevibacillus laterosporus]
MNTGIVVFSDDEAVRSSDGGIWQYANGFTVNKDIILRTIEAKIDNPYISSGDATIAVWDDTGKLITQSTKSIPQNTRHTWFSFGLTPIKITAGKEYVVGMTASGVRLLLANNENLPKIIKSSTVGFDFTIKNHRSRFSDTYTSAPPVDRYQYINDFKLIGDFNSAPTITLTANNQPITENQRINIGTNDFTVNITANEADPNDTLQYQVKLNNVVKRAWTTIAKNQPVSYTFKNADITAGVNPFTVSVRDDKGNQTDFNGYLDKSWLVEDITSSVEIRRAEVYELGVSRGSIFGSTKSEIRRRSDGSIYLLLSFTHRLSPKGPNGNDFPLYFKRITPYPETYHPEASEIVTTGGNITKIEHTIAGNTIIFSADIPPTLIGKTITNLQYYSKYMDPAQEFFFQADYGGRSAASFTRFALKNNIVIKSSWFNTAPTLNVASPADNQTLTENTTVNIQGTASDTDKDNVVTIKYRINNNTTRALQSG